MKNYNKNKDGVDKKNDDREERSESYSEPIVKKTKIITDSPEERQKGIKTSDKNYLNRKRKFENDFILSKEKNNFLKNLSKSKLDDILPIQHNNIKDKLNIKKLTKSIDRKNNKIINIKNNETDKNSIVKNKKILKILMISQVLKKVI